MPPFEKLTGNKPRNAINNCLGLGNPEATLITMVKGPNEQPLGTERLDALDLAEFESARTWGRSRNTQELKRFINEQSKGRKRKVSKFIVETNRNRKGWESKFGGKSKKVTGETKHTVKVGNRIYIKRMWPKFRKK